MNIVPVFDTAKRDRDGIAIYWKNCKSNRSTHAVLVKKGKNIFNPGNVKIERLRSFIYFVTMFPPKL